MIGFLIGHYRNVNSIDGPHEESSDLVRAVAGTFDKDENEKIRKILEHPESRRWCCAVDARPLKETSCSALFLPHHSGAVLLCVGFAPDEKSFWELVKTLMHNKYLVRFDIMECHESPIGSLGEDVEQSCLELEKTALEKFQSQGITNRGIYLYVPAILRYGRGSEQN